MGAGEYTGFERVTAAGLSSVIADGTPNGFLATSYDGCVYRVAAWDRDAVEAR